MFGFYAATRRGAAFGVATGYRVDNPTTGFRAPVGQQFSLRHVVRIFSETYLASYAIYTVIPWTLSRRYGNRSLKLTAPLQLVVLRVLNTGATSSYVYADCSQI
jgi:hypothetical protein